MSNRCSDCGEVEGTHAANCIKLRERDYRPPKTWKEITARRNITAAIDYEATAGRRREDREELR